MTRMLSLADARKIAEAHLKSIEPEVGLELVLLDESTMEQAFGWLMVPFMLPGRRSRSNTTSPIF